MDFSLRVRLSVMMFLQYFVWGAWGVVIFTFISNLPTAGGLDFPGDYQGWIGATLPIGAMISPLFIGLFADRLFATERVLALLHLAGAGLLVWAAVTCDRGLPEIRRAFEAAARSETVDGASVLDASAHEQALEKEAGSAAATNARLEKYRADVKAAVSRINDTEAVRAEVNKVYTPLLWILLGYALCYMPTITLTNSLSFRNLSDPDRYFGSIRVLGTIGWIVAGIVVGFRLSASSTQPLYLAAGASLLLGLFSFFLPHTPPSGGAKTLGDTLGLPALGMLKNPSFLVFFVCSFLITIVLAFYYQQGNPFLTAIKAPNPVALQTIGQVSEIFFMLMIPVGLAWLGTKGMLAVGMLAWCIRYAVFATLNVPAVVWIGLPLHGICYDFFFVVSYLYVDRQAPQHLRASAQGLITFVTLGVGMFMGNLLAGAVVQACMEGKALAWAQKSIGGNVGHALSSPWTLIWLVPLAGSVLATFLFVLLFRERQAGPAAVSLTKALEGLEPVEPPEQVH